MSSSKKAYHVHGNKGVYCGGEWIPIEECGDWVCPKECSGDIQTPTANANLSEADDENILWDVVIIGAGCIGTSIARELSRYSLKVLLLERDDDVTQGATKGNSGIIHAGYDDKPNTNKSKFCWPGNQMFPELDRELKFGFLKNGSLVIARSKEDEAHLQQLYDRGQENGIQRLRIIGKEELHEMEPHLGEDCIAALYSPDAGTVTPYEFTIALAENAAMNGVQIRTRHEVIGIEHDDASSEFTIRIKKWSYSATSDIHQIAVDNAARRIFSEPVPILELPATKMLIPSVISAIAIGFVFDDEEVIVYKYAMMALLFVFCVVLTGWIVSKQNTLKGSGGLFSLQRTEQYEVKYEEMTPNKVIRSRFVVNCGGLFSDKIAQMVGDHSFKIKPRIGDYLLLHKDQGHLAKCTLFPCPDTKIGTKGVLVQTTLWGNLILGPTARDVYKPETQKQSADEIMKFLLTKSRQLVPSIDAANVIHSFAGSRAKSDRGDWIIERAQCGKEINFFNVAGIDSPGLAGSPAIALHVVHELLVKEGGLELVENKAFNPYRKPTIFPKKGWKGLKLKKVPKSESDLVIGKEAEMKRNVVCKCERVTEYEIVDAMSRCGVRVDTTQAIRRRTRAGMGHCQADAGNCNCELYVAHLIAKKQQMSKVGAVGRRPWPATSLLNKRWLDDADKKHLQSLAK